MKQHLSIFGATGSIGKLTLDLLASMSAEKPSLFLLTGSTNVRHMLDAICSHSPDFVFMFDRQSNETLRKLVAESKLSKTRIIESVDSLLSLFESDGGHFFINGIMGINGIVPTLISQRYGIRSATANKESIILSYELTRDFNPDLVFPLDSEHFSLSRLLHQTDAANTIRKCTITASGGRVFNKTDAQLRSLGLEEILEHPNWKMGKRITIDSSTGVNKTYESIEAQALFGFPHEIMEIAINPSSHIHAIVETTDGMQYYAVSAPDMHIPIAAFFREMGYPVSWCPKMLDKWDAIMTLHPIGLHFPILQHFFERYDRSRQYGSLLLNINSALQDKLLSGKISFHTMYTVLPEIMSTALEKDITTGDVTFSSPDSFERVTVLMSELGKIASKAIGEVL